MKKILLVMFIVLFTVTSGFCGEFKGALKKMRFSFIKDPRWSELDMSVKEKILWVAFQRQVSSDDPLWSLLPDYIKKAETDTYFQAARDYETAFYSEDYNKSFNWYTKVAEQENAWAQFELGWMYDKGWGVTQNYKQAAYWYTKAAEQGDASAQNNLGVLYDHGKGVVQNHKHAYIWFSLAAAQGDELAIKNRNQSAQKLTSQQLSEAQDLAAKIQYRIDNPEKQKPPSVTTTTPRPKKHAPTTTSAELVRWVQRTLKNLGYKPGPVDGVTGDRTRSAIIAFQTDLGIAPTGVIDEVLVAQIRQISKNNKEPAKVVTGTGFLITNDGYILTCHHVVEDAEQINIIKGGESFQAQLIRSDPKNDLAILKINGSFSALAFSPHRSAKMGQDVFTVGYPNPSLQGVSAKYTKGTISSLTGFQDDLRLYQISIPIQPGNSGGALLDEQGNILGIVVAMLSAKTSFQMTGSLPQNVNYAVKSLYAQAMIDTMPGVAGKLLAPSKSKSGAIDNAQESTVMVVCYD
jgi:S1-C subfamily serine protease